MSTDTYRGGAFIQQVPVMTIGAGGAAPFNGDPSTIFHCIPATSSAGAPLTKVVAFYADGTQTETVLNG